MPEILLTSNVHVFPVTLIPITSCLESFNATNGLALQCDWAIAFDLSSVGLQSPEGESRNWGESLLVRQFGRDHPTPAPIYSFTNIDI